MGNLMRLTAAAVNGDGITPLPGKQEGRALPAHPAFSPAALPTPSSTKHDPISDGDLLRRLRNDSRWRSRCLLGRSRHRKRRRRCHDDQRLVHLAIAPAWLRRLEGAARVEFAIGETRHFLLAAEV